MGRIPLMPPLSERSSPRMGSPKAVSTDPKGKPSPFSWPPRRVALAMAVLLVTSPVAASCSSAPPSAGASSKKPSTSAVWLCRPVMSHDPCASSLTTTEVEASGAKKVVHPKVASAASKFDCFYVYPTVSLETSANANLDVQSTETEIATQQAAQFSRVCRVWAPMYRQFTVDGLAQLSGTVIATAYASLKTAFEDYLSHDNDGRPIIFIGHSQGAVMLIDLLYRLVDDNPTLRDKLVLAILLGGNVVVPPGKLSGGSFTNIPLCSTTGQTGCVIAYSSYPGTPPAASEFGRPGQGASLFTGQLATTGVQVACVNPAAIGGGSAVLDPVFPATAANGPVPFHSTEGKISTPWVTYPGLYRATCESSDDATWLNVTKATGPSDRRPVVEETNHATTGGQHNLTAVWGYHVYDVNLALGNLVSDVAAAEASWSAQK
jgi:Protein of unknown function (DUF3089)